MGVPATQNTLQIEDVEHIFLSRLAERGVDQLDIRRDEQTGELLVTRHAPCADVGYIRARLRDLEITLSCRLSSKHASAAYFQAFGVREPQRHMVHQAANDFADFVQGRAFVELEVRPNGQPGAAGWRLFGEPRERNPRYRSLIECLDGAPPAMRAWSWQGPVEGVEWDY